MGVSKAVSQLRGAIGRRLQRIARLLDGVEDLHVVVVADGSVGLGCHHAHDRGAEDRREVVVGVVAHQLEVRLLGVVGVCGGDLLGEVRGNDHGVVVGALLQPLLGLVGVIDEVPLERIGVLERFDKVVAGGDQRAARGARGNVLVDHGNRQRVKVVVGVVEGHEVEGAVDQRDECNAQHGDLHAQAGACGIIVEQREAQAAQRVLHD